MKFRISGLLTLIILACSLSVHLQAQDSNGVYYTENGSATFYSRVPLHSFEGNSDHLVGQINLITDTVDFYLDLETLKTGIEKRDRDMRETLNTDEHPFAEFFGVLITPFNADTSIEQKVEVNGDFTINGVSNEVTIPGTLQMTEDGLQLTASWTLLLDDYKIRPPQVLFVKVDQQQKIEIKALLKPVDR